MSRSKLLWTFFFAFLLAGGAFAFVATQLLDTHKANILQTSLREHTRFAKTILADFFVQSTKQWSNWLKSPNRQKWPATANTPQQQLQALWSALPETQRPTFLIVSNIDGKTIASVHAQETPLNKAPPISKNEGSSKPQQPARQLWSQEGTLYYVLQTPWTGSREASSPDTTSPNSKESPQPPKRPQKAPTARKQKCPKGKIWACIKICQKRVKRRCIRYLDKKKCGCYRLRRRKKKTSRNTLYPPGRPATAYAMKAPTPQPASTSLFLHIGIAFQKNQLNGLKNKAHLSNVHWLLFQTQDKTVLSHTMKSEDKDKWCQAAKAEIEELE
ncbi:MAG: hypothetical protein AAGJ35_04645, partial [Myxococcota bacterium]